MNEKILDQKVKMPKISGTTTINHEARVKLQLTCSEYVMMDYLYKCKNKGIPPEIEKTFINTGFSHGEQEIILKSLVKKDFIRISSFDALPAFTPKWEEGFPNGELEFIEEFWRKDGKAIWLTSSRKASLKFYTELRKVYPKEVIIEARNHYLEYLEWERKRGFDRAIMMAERWLNPKNEHFMTDWKEMTDQIKKKLNPEPVQAAKQPQITSEERKKEYDK